MRTRLISPQLIVPGVCILAFVASVYAGEDDAADETETITLEKITVIAGKRPQAPGDVAGTVTVMDRERIERQLARNIKDIVRYEPGVSVRNNPNRFGSSGFNIRGVDGNRVVMELDGVPVSESFAIGSFSDSGRDYVDPEILKRVEILRGPASTLYGSNALGGVVTYTTMDPADFLAAAGEDRYAGLRTGFSSADHSFVATATAAASAGALQGLLVYSRRAGSDLDNSTDADGAQPNPRDYTSDSILAKLLYGTARGDLLRLTVDYSSYDAATDVQSLVGGPGRFATTTLLVGDDHQQRTRVSGDYEFSQSGAWFDDGVWSVFHQRSEIEQHTVENRSASSRSPTPSQRRRVFSYDQKVAGTELTLRKEIAAARARHYIVYGLEASTTHTDELRDGLLVNLEDGSSSKGIIGEEFPVRDFPKSDTIQVGAYAQDEIAIDSSRWTLIPGLRFEYYELDPHTDPIFAEDNPDTMVTGLSETNQSPKLGFLYHASDSVTLFGQYARGFRSPPFDDVNIGFTIPQFGYTAIPNPDLGPETSNGLEFGARLEAGRGRATFTGFYNDYEDFIESRVNLGVDPDTGLLTFQSQNRAEATIYGVEFGGSYTIGSLLEGDFTLKGSVAYAHGDDDERGQPLNTVDPLSGVFGLRFDAANGRWGTELITTLVAEKHRIDDSMIDLFQPPGYGIVDLIGHYQLGEHSRLNWGLFNLTDKKYWEWSDVRGRPADDPLIELYTRPGRNASVSLSLRW